MFSNWIIIGGKFFSKKKKNLIEQNKMGTLDYLLRIYIAITLVIGSNQKNKLPPLKRTGKSIYGLIAALRLNCLRHINLNKYFVNVTLWNLLKLIQYKYEVGAWKIWCEDMKRKTSKLEKKNVYLPKWRFFFPSVFNFKFVCVCAMCMFVVLGKI